jgi:hypothetical protein
MGERIKARRTENKRIASTNSAVYTKKSTTPAAMMVWDQFREVPRGPVMVPESERPGADAVSMTTC